MNRFRFLFSGLICLLALFLSLSSTFAQGPTEQTSPVSPEERTAVEQAIYDAVKQHEGERLVTLLYQTQVLNLTFSSDGQWARAWLVPVDAQTGETAPVEPGLAVARNEATGWSVFLQPDAAWLEAIQASPATLFPTAEKTMWADMSRQVQDTMSTTVFTGYRLPWKAGEIKSLSESVMHDKYYPSRASHYAFDFYEPGSKGKLFDLYAAKSGTVFLAKDDVPTCTQPHCDGQGSGNYLVVKDTTTTPTSYILYLHLAQNSIPPELKQIGAPVQRGHFIGIADNTGASYGNHLHFQVQTFPDGNPIWFGRSVDIVFDDVDINGGRPRVKDKFYDDEPYCLHEDGYNDVCDDFQTSYLSRNTPCQIPDSTPPDGELLQPDRDGIPVTNMVSLSGWGEDDECGFAAGQFIANYNGAWHDIGPAFTTSPFSYEFNLCDIPDGTIDFGLRLTDLAVNSTIVGVHSLSKDYTCPAPPVPACIPDVNEVMLFDAEEYTGACIPFAPGDFADLGILENQASSILVGTNVQVTLILGDNFAGRSETFYTNDNNLTDNRIGSNTAGAIRVNWRTQQSSQPTLISPANGSLIPLHDVVTLIWENGVATAETEVMLSSSGTVPFTSSWQTSAYIHLESLSAGDYTWQVRGRNTTGVGAWSIPFTFSIAENVSTPPPAVPAPYTDTMEINPSDWTGTGLWRHVKDSSLAHSGNRSWWYQEADGDYANGQANSGNLTSPPYSISTTGHYYLRFYYRYTTETQGAYWDQRWAQISIDNGPYRFSTQLVAARQQLTDDPIADELYEPYISSQVYDLGVLTPGQSVRIRFHFDTLDANRNAYQGWAIDDVNISTSPPGDSGDFHEPNNIPAEATDTNIGSQIDGAISPKGDFDYFKFTASAGNRLVVDLDAQSLGSSLDPFMFLLDSDGVSILAQNDDEIPGENRDSFISFYAPHTGSYYLKLRAWNNPRVGGSQFFYTLRLYNDNADPVMVFANPANDAGYLNNLDNSLSASVNDSQSGVSQVDFYFHDSNWIDHNWELLGSDKNGADGWNAPFDRPDQNEIALFVKAIDYSRNITGQGYWYLSIDRTPPQTSLFSLPATQDSTAFLVEWNGSDNLAGLNYYELQWAIDGEYWSIYPPTLTGYTLSTWIIGAPGHHYDFRMNGIDRAGNAETFPVVAETSTNIPDDICPFLDEWETDNTPLLASPIIIAQAQSHNLCNPETQNGLNDTDWITFTVQAGQRYLIQAIPTAPNAATDISIFTENGITLTLREEMKQNVWGIPAVLDWVASTSEVLYIRIQHTDERVAGSTVTYQLYVTKNYPVFMPVISRRP